MKELEKGVHYVGVNDKKIDLFEGLYNVPHGISYNSYVIVDKKIAVMDTVDNNFGVGWLNKIETLLGENIPDYLVVLHMEPDHSSNIEKFIKKYPKTKIVGNSKTFLMINEFFGCDFSFERLEVKEGDSLSLGNSALKFIFAPLVHWPEVMFAYWDEENALFSADAFGAFGTLDYKQDWLDEGRRYYFGIVGKFGVQVQNVLKKVSMLKINKIYPLHGNVLSDNLSFYLDKYHLWSTYQSEVNGVLIAYSSVYGHTKACVDELQSILKGKNIKVEAVDICRTDWALCVANAFKYSAIVLATTTYNGDIFPTMREFIDRLKERNFKNRIVGLLENGSWSPVANRVMRDRLVCCQNLNFCSTQVKIRSALNSESRVELCNLAQELIAKLN